MTTTRAWYPPYRPTHTLPIALRTPSLSTYAHPPYLPRPSSPISLCACYAMSATDLAYRGTCLRACYAKCPVQMYCMSLSAYVLAMQCVVLTYCMALPGGLGTKPRGC
eukprot:3263362-Rhodomonas_salina.1